MNLTELTVRDLLAAFRSPDPTPGGGSAAALAGAIGASLLAMVAGLPKTRAASEEDVERLRTAGVRLADLSAQLAQLVERDSQAYALVMEAYRLPKGTEEEKAARSARIQKALDAAIGAPLEVMRASRAATEQAVVVAQFGNRNAASDVRVALELLRAAVRGAQYNVEINLDSLKDTARAGSVQAETVDLTAAADREAASAAAHLA